MTAKELGELREELYEMAVELAAKGDHRCERLAEIEQELWKLQEEMQDAN